MGDNPSGLMLRNTRVATDANGNVCLNDLWHIGGGDDNRRPNKWWRGQAAKALTSALLEKIGRDSPNLPPATEEAVYFSTGRGRSSRTYAHPVLALAYAEFVDPQLGIEIREVYLRYKAGDVTLALEIMEGMTEQAEYDALRVQLRKLVKEHNKMSAGVAQDAGVKNFEAYNGAGLRGLYGMSKTDLLDHKGLPEDAHHLEHAGHEELAANYFKATQAIAKLKRDSIKGQADANAAHEFVGAAVRQTIKDLGGTMPEDEQALEHIREAEKRLKAAAKAAEPLALPARPRKKAG